MNWNEVSAIVRHANPKAAAGKSGKAARKIARRLYRDLQNGDDGTTAMATGGLYLQRSDYRPETGEWDYELHVSLGPITEWYGLVVEL